LESIEGSGNFLSKQFYYNHNGQVNKEETHFNNRLYQRFTFKYENGMPSECTLEDGSGNPLKKMQVSYDQMPNPFKDKGMIVNSFEQIYGHTLSNTDHNITRVIVTYLADSTFVINDEMMKKGQCDTTYYQYTYNLFGFPTLIGNDISIEYSFFPKKRH
jgi:hypothetical protein